MHPYFFGYGSLVNRETHTYPDARPAQLKGWRRSWIRTAKREVVFLSVTPDADTVIDGLIASVPDADWRALDAREFGYGRHDSRDAVIHDIMPAPEVAHYAIAPADQMAGGNHVILLSYLDVVVQGYLREHGVAGVTRFFETTSGWDTPVRNDRENPGYSRFREVTTEEQKLVDDNLLRLSARVE